MTFHATIKFIINSLTDKVLVQSCQICAMYTIWRWFRCAVTGTLTCGCKTFTTLRRTFFGSNASMNHACLICKSNLLYIDTCLYIFVLYTLFNIIYLIKSWKKKNFNFSSKYEPNLFSPCLLFFCCGYNK